MAHTCQRCGSLRSDVVGTWETAKTINRRRKCKSCSALWTTCEIERPQHDYIESLKALAADARRLSDRIENALAHLERHNPPPEKGAARELRTWLQNGKTNGENLRSV